MDKRAIRIDSVRIVLFSFWIRLIMTKFESGVKVVPASQEAVYEKLSDLSNLEKVKDRLPEDKVKNLSFDAESPTPMWIYTIHPFPLRIHQWLYKVQWGLYIIHPEDIHRCFVFDWHFWICEILRTSKPKRKVNAFSNLCQFPHHPNRRGAIENYTKIQFNWTNR